MKEQGSTDYIATDPHNQIEQKNETDYSRDYHTTNLIQNSH
jgi:hypothetical protein